eukprot:gene8016-biopygen13632
MELQHRRHCQGWEPRTVVVQLEPYPWEKRRCPASGPRPVRRFCGFHRAARARSASGPRPLSFPPGAALADPRRRPAERRSATAQHIRAVWHLNVHYSRSLTGLAAFPPVLLSAAGVGCWCWQSLRLGVGYPARVWQRAQGTGHGAAGVG